jgi:hypothetical protein
MGTSSSGVSIGGFSNSGYGVLGSSTSGYGVYASSSSGAGLYGSSSSSVGVEGFSTSSFGVSGMTDSTATTTAAAIFVNGGSTSAGNILLGAHGQPGDIGSTIEFTVDAKGDVTGAGAAKFASYSVSGTAPTCAFSTGGGTTPSCKLDTGSTNSAGIIIATTGSGSPAGTGTITLTFSATFGADKPVCLYQASDDGTGTWNGLAVMKDKTPTTASDLFTWTNGASPTSLTVSKTYYINYHCFAK